MKIEERGLLIDIDVPFVAASPDGVVSCDCCGEFCLEVKCPFTKKDSTLTEDNDKNFYLQKNTRGKLTLVNTHSYYYQVQTQLGVGKYKSCYFVVWTNKDIHIEVIEFDNLMWHNMLMKATHIFECGVLPELVSKFYSLLPNPTASTTAAQTSTSPTRNDSDEDEIWCYCRKSVPGEEMVACDNKSCPIEWFHFHCVSISKAPKGRWYCPDCRKLPKFKRGLKCKNMLS